MSPVPDRGVVGTYVLPVRVDGTVHVRLPTPAIAVFMSVAISKTEVFANRAVAGCDRAVDVVTVSLKTEVFANPAGRGRAVAVVTVSLLPSVIGPRSRCVVCRTSPLTNSTSTILPSSVTRVDT